MALDFFAGCVGGIAGVLVGHPLDTVKVHLQTQDPRNPTYRGTWHCFKTLFVQEHIRGLYRGLTSPMAGIGAVNAIVFGIYGNVSRYAEDPNSLKSHFIAGSTAGFCQSIVCSPMELAKTRMQLMHVEHITFKCPLECLTHIYRTESAKGMFKGLGITAMRDVPGFSSYFVSYEYLIRLPQSPKSWHSLVAGGLAGICSWMCCYPMDVVKTSIQADGMSHSPQYKGVMDCIQKGYRSDGIHFFFRGFNSTILRAFPMNAACFYVVSLIMSLAPPTGIDLVLNPESCTPFVGSPALPYAGLPQGKFDNAELERKRSVMMQGLRGMGTFQETVCQTEVEELANEFYPAEGNQEYIMYKEENTPSSADDS